jgi:hypothetical protein
LEVTVPVIKLETARIEEALTAELEKQCLSDKIYWTITDETIQITPIYAIPGLRLWVGLRKNALDPNSLIWFVGNTSAYADLAYIPTFVTEAMTLLRQERRKYMNEITKADNGSLGKPQGPTSPFRPGS